MTLASSDDDGNGYKTVTVVSVNYELFNGSCRCASGVGSGWQSLACRQTKGKCQQVLAVRRLVLQSGDGPSIASN